MSSPKSVCLHCTRVSTASPKHVPSSAKGTNWGRPGSWLTSQGAAGATSQAMYKHLENSKGLEVTASIGYS